MSYDLTLTQLRSTAAQFIASNPVPASGVLCVETDTDVTKTGDGATAYRSLPRTQLSSDERRSADDLWAASQRSVSSTAPMYVDGVAYDGIAKFNATGNLTNGYVVLDFTALIPSVTLVEVTGMQEKYGSIATLGVVSEVLSAYTFSVVDAGGSPMTGAECFITVMYKLA